MHTETSEMSVVYTTIVNRRKEDTNKTTKLENAAVDITIVNKTEIHFIATFKLQSKPLFQEDNIMISHPTKMLGCNLN